MLGRTDPTYFLMCAQTYWRGLDDPCVGDFLYEGWHTQVWFCLLLWAEESYV